MLKEIVDDTSRGRYDFMYLRIGWLSMPLMYVRLLNHGDQILQTTASKYAGKQYSCSD